MLMKDANPHPHGSAHTFAATRFPNSARTFAARRRFSDRWPPPAPRGTPSALRRRRSAARATRAPPADRPCATVCLESRAQQPSCIVPDSPAGHCAGAARRLRSARTGERGRQWREGGKRSVEGDLVDSDGSGWTASTLCRVEVTWASTHNGSPRPRRLGD
jgi:hypothetical protein